MTIHTIPLNINGETEVVDVPAHWTLLQMLREKLGLTGTKNGCAGGECGACTVMLNGAPVNSCMVFGVECDGRRNHHRGRPSPRWQIDPRSTGDHGSRWCPMWFLHTGVLISAKALLDRNPDPTEEEIKESLVGNLCRCTGYVRIIEGIKEAAKLQ